MEELHNKLSKSKIRAKIYDLLTSLQMPQLV